MKDIHRQQAIILLLFFYVKVTLGEIEPLLVSRLSRIQKFGDAMAELPGRGERNVNMQVGSGITGLSHFILFELKC